MRSLTGALPGEFSSADWEKALALYQQLQKTLPEESQEEPDQGANPLGCSAFLPSDGDWQKMLLSFLPPAWQKALLWYLAFLALSSLLSEKPPTQQSRRSF